MQSAVVFALESVGIEPPPFMAAADPREGARPAIGGAAFRTCKENLESHWQRVLC
jgi:hypothetical protein